jgi:pyruvate-formate lyase-activating enzyme
MSKLNIEVLNPKTRLTLNEITEIESVALKHLSFSLTLACPLRCSHCITRSGPEKAYSTISLDTARSYAIQMDELYEHGIRTISFTGGEPLLAIEPLKVISDAASKAGMICGLVTSAYWASSDRTAEKVVKSVPGITIWDISVDIYHQEFVGYDNILSAYRSIKKLGNKAGIRYSYHDPITDADKRIFDFIANFVDPSDFYYQRIRNTGRAQDLKIADHRYIDNPWMKPCFTTGLNIRYDGSIAPCCCNLVEERSHPFQFGDAKERPLVEIHSEFLRHPLLQMIRVIGFTEAIQWLNETDLASEIDGPLPDDICDICLKLLSNPRIGQYLANRASEPMNKLKIAILLSRLLGDHYMLRYVINELKEISSEIDGFELAEALIEEIERDYIDTNNSLIRDHKKNGRI